MLIFDEFYQALSSVISTYPENKTARGKTISTQRQKDLQAFQQVLGTAKRTHQSAALLHEEVSNFLGTLNQHPLATIFPPIFGSDLYQAIQSVLDKPTYREMTLIAKEQAELKAQQNRIEGYLQGKNVTKLVKRLEALESEREANRKAYATLNQQYQKTKAEKYQLEIENAQLKAKLAALEGNAEEKPKSEKSKPNTQPTSASIPLKSFT